MHRLLVMTLTARKKHGWLAQKVRSKKSDYLVEIKNRYKVVKEEEAWRHLFVERNNDYIEEEITWVQTLT